MDKSVLDRYAEEVQSGATSYTATKRPEMHPDSLFAEKPASSKKEKLKLFGLIGVFVLLVLLNGLTFYQLRKQSKAKEAVTEEFKADIGWPEEFADIEVSAEPAYETEQEAAIEGIRAWERQTRALIDRFFREPIPKGYKRTLCITTGGQSRCRTLEHGQGLVTP